jgi:hypothetical protein
MCSIRNNFIHFGIILFALSSCNVKKNAVISESNIWGNYINHKEKIELIIKSDSTFIIKQDLKREVCQGSWRLENDTVYLLCSKPIYLSGYFTSYNLNIDAKYTCRYIRNDKLIFEGVKLKKNSIVPLSVY